MPYLLSASHIQLPHCLPQEEAKLFAKRIFGPAYKDIERLLRAFKNGEVDTRYFAVDLDWFNEPRSFEERNDLYIKEAVSHGLEAVKSCLESHVFLSSPVLPEEIEAIFFISSTGLATPTIDARILNFLPGTEHMKRIPIWGLGCAGGASGLSRAYEYCLAYPEAKVLILSVELCSLTFQQGDVSKSNLIGTSLFADGAACVLMCGDEADRMALTGKEGHFSIEGTQSALMPDSLDIMGWDVKDGLYVVFSRDIPTVIRGWLKPNVDRFLTEHGTDIKDIDHFIAHPGGKKVIDAYLDSLQLAEGQADISKDVLRKFGNMSSATILYVLERFMEKGASPGSLALAAALGPGFSSELLLMRWS